MRGRITLMITTMSKWKKTKKIFFTYYSRYILNVLQRKKTPSIACSSSPDYDSYKVPLSCYEQELVMMVVDDTVARLRL